MLNALLPNNYKGACLLASKPFIIISKMGRRAHNPFSAPFLSLSLIYDHPARPSLF